MLALVEAGCSSGGSPLAPCDLDCGPYGSCVIVRGHEECLCHVGYQGLRCDDCAPGYVDHEEACTPDPCSPNPCHEPHQTTCTVVEGTASCACDEDAQDHDEDGTCRPTCAVALQGYGPQECDDSTGEALFIGPRTCDSMITYDPGDEVVTTLYLRGEHNDWDLSQPMVQEADGTFSLSLQLAPGHYGYKLYDPAGERWLEDPANPDFKWIDGERNSRLIVEDCNNPYLRLMHRPDASDQAIQFKVQYVDGATSAGLGPEGVIVTRNGVGISAGLDAATGVVTIQDSGLPPGKHAYRFYASDAAGRAARRLYVPVWLEPEPFSWSDAVLYFAMTDRFADGDSTNNAPVPDVDPRSNWQGGDFAGLLQTLESGYFADLGVNAIWLSSISQNTGRAGMGDYGPASGYHSYWPISTGWREGHELPGVEPVDPHFGTLAEFKELVQEAHEQGIRVLVDLVANHVHEDSPLWTHHQTASPPWFHLPAVGCKESNWSEPITCWFASYLPDLEYQNHEVMEELVEHAVWLVEETDIDGFRLDAVKHMIDDFVITIRGRLARRLRFSGQRFYMVGETFTGEDGADLLKHYVGPDRLDGQFDFPLYWHVTATLLREERNLAELQAMASGNDGQYGEWAIMSTFLGNHDVCRALTQATGEIGDLYCSDGKELAWSSPPTLPDDEEPFQRLRLAWTFLFTSPGIPLIYYGDELGMEGAGDPDNRRPMRFGSELTSLQEATLAHVQALTAARHAHPATRRGQRRTLHLASDGLLWVYALSTPGDDVVVALNQSDAPRTEEVDVSALGFSDGSLLTDLLGGDGVAVQRGRVTLTLDPRSSAVLVLQ